VTDQLNNLTQQPQGKPEDTLGQHAARAQSEPLLTPPTSEGTPPAEFEQAAAGQPVLSGEMGALADAGGPAAPGPLEPTEPQGEPPAAVPGPEAEEAPAEFARAQGEAAIGTPAEAMSAQPIAEAMSAQPIAEAVGPEPAAPQDEMVTTGEPAAPGGAAAFAPSQPGGEAFGGTAETILPAASEEITAAAPEAIADVMVPELPPSPPAEPVAAKVEEPKSDKLDWYILKVQSNREDSIRDGLLRRVAIAGLERYFGDVIIPTEKVTEFKAGKKRVTKRKLYPGYLVVHMEINDDTWFLVRETPGIGDFTGAAGRPSPMLPHEVARILAKQEEKSEKAPKLKIGFSPGDQVKINEGTFENFEGEVESIDETNGRVTVMINIFGRSTPVELEYWQIGAV